MLGIVIYFAELSGNVLIREAVIMTETRRDKASMTESIRRESDTRDFHALLATHSYDFLRENAHLGNSIDSLFLGGSIAYGLDTPSSDTDIRGFAIRSARDILTSRDWETFVETQTDTTVYSFDKFVMLLAKANPNIVEFLGLRDSHHIETGHVGRALLDNADAFLSRRVARTFGGYALAQLNRLENAVLRTGTQEEAEDVRARHIERSTAHAIASFADKFDHAADLRIMPKAIRERDGYRMYVTVSGCLPLSEASAMLAETATVERSYDKLNGRNRKRDAAHLAKHMSHLVRLYRMGTEILRGDGVITNRQDAGDAGFLMDIKRGRYMREDGTAKPEFWELVEEETARFDEAEKASRLPDDADMKRIMDIVESENRHVICGKER